MSERSKENSHLVVKDGKIITESVEIFIGPETVQMASHKAAIWPNGDIGEFLLTQADRQIRLTMQQAEALAKEIQRRL